MCTNPRFISRPDGSRMAVGCGHCLQCLKQYQDVWNARLNEECKQWKPVVQDGRPLPPIIFFTLDYAPERIPCRYLVVTDNGVRLQDVCPDGVPVHRFWTDLRELNSGRWPVRRRALLSEYYRLTKLVWSLVERRATADDIRNGNYEYAFVTPTGRVFGPCVFSSDLPDFEPSFKCFPNSVIDYLNFDYEVLYDCAGIGRPIAAFEFHSVLKSDVQDLFKRARRQAEYYQPDVFGLKVNPRMLTTWKDVGGVDHEYPTAALTKSFKYFVTSEYGPQTFRPHYHGVCFGFTYDEFKRYIADDWETKGYGHCDFSVLRPTAGALTYISKYCSKGNYEHPLCCRDFIYPPREDGSIPEYHSLHYELSVATFGVDKALVQPTFHLISKGIGACYAFGQEVQEYFGVALSELFTASGNVRFSSTDAVSLPAPSISLDKLLCLQDNSQPAFKCSSIDIRDNGDIVIRKYDNNDHLIGESVVPASAVISTAIEDSLTQKLYTRTYVTSSNSGASACLACWHKIGLQRLCNPVTKTTSISLPRYYRQWLVSPLASLLRQASAVRLHPSVYEIASQLLEHGRPSDEVQSLVSRLMADQEVRNGLTTQRLWQSAQNLLRTYSPRLR